MGARRTFETCDGLHNRFTARPGPAARQLTIDSSISGHVRARGARAERCKAEDCKVNIATALA